MTQVNSLIDVVAAVIQRNSKYLVCQRPSHKRHGGLWEFPGGKVVLGESFEQAITRELQEELELNVVESGPVQFSASEIDSQFNIVFIPVQVEGSAVLREHNAKMWCSLHDLTKLKLAPVDAKFVESLKRS